MTRSAVIVALAAAILVASPFANATGGDERSRLPIRFTQPITSAGSEVLVEKGDHLWSISSDQLQDATTAEISSLWREVIAVNIDRLRSGNPDLIYPGEWVLVPAPTTDSR
jgi:nucleoid-associated protein YgaU